MPPSIQAGPRVIKVQVGHPVELPCVVTGVPEPTLTWTKDGKRYPPLHDGSLALRSVGLHDEGTYTCTAMNSAGRDEARVQLLVQGWFLRPTVWVVHDCFIEIKPKDKYLDLSLTANRCQLWQCVHVRVQLSKCMPSCFCCSLLHLCHIDCALSFQCLLW